MVCYAKIISIDYREKNMTDDELKALVAVLLLLKIALMSK